MSSIGMWRYRLASLGVIGLTGVLLGSPAQADDLLTLATSGVNDGQLPYYVADSQKYFAAEHISTTLQTFSSGSGAVQAFSGGSVDFCICAADHVVELVNRGVKARILFDLDAHFPNVVVAKSNSPFIDLKSLRGKKIGITGPSSSTDNAIRWEIARLGLDADSDFQLVSVGSGIPMMAALKTGAIDAGILGNNEVINAQLNLESPLKIIVDWRKLDDASLVVIGTQTWVDRNPNLARRFVRAMVAASKAIQNDHKAAVAGVKTMFEHRSDAFLEATATSTAARLSKDGSVAPQGYANMQAIVLKSDPTIHAVPQKDVDLFPTLSQLTVQK